MCPLPAFTPVDVSEDAAESAPSLRRPRLLMAAARHGLAEYRRTRDLPRLLGGCPTATVAAAHLAEMEGTAEAARRMGNPSWSCTRHVELLIALMAERAVSVG